MYRLTAFPRRLPYAVLLGAVAAASATCDGKQATSEPVPVAVLKVSGDGQSGQVNQRLAQPLVVRVVDANGAGVAALRVAWASRHLRPYASDTTMTDRDGFASAQIALDTLVGLYTILASVGYLPPAVFTATGTAGPAGTAYAPLFLDLPTAARAAAARARSPAAGARSARR